MTDFIDLAASNIVNATQNAVVPGTILLPLGNDGADNLAPALTFDTSGAGSRMYQPFARAEGGHLTDPSISLNRKARYLARRDHDLRVDPKSHRFTTWSGVSHGCAVKVNDTVGWALYWEPAGEMWFVGTDGSFVEELPQTTQVDVFTSWRLGCPRGDEFDVLFEHTVPRD